MEIVPYNNNIEEYLKLDNVIDYDNESIQQLADSLFEKADSELEFIKHAYEFVRDNVAHSADIGEDLLTCAASEVLEAGHGICFAKSHLLAAILRCKSIPAGLCYQKLILDDETKEIAKEIVCNDALDRVFIATDYFDASINRLSAWVTGVRNVQKALLNALLLPANEMKKLQNDNDFTALMCLQEEIKTAPFGDIWAEYLVREGIEKDYLSQIKEYEEKVLVKRV